MENTDLLYETKYKLTLNDLDCYDRISIPGILNIFQDVADLHATKLLTGYYALLEKNIVWILIRTRFDVVSVPKYASTVKVKTWQSYQGKADFERDYLLLDEENNVLVKGSSKWCLIDVATRRIQPSSIIKEDITYKKRNYPNRLEKVDFNNFTSSKTQDFTVMASQVDHNLHMNNTKYGALIVDHIDLKEDEIISSFEIDYIKEVKKNEVITLESMRNNKEIYIQGKCCDALSIRSRVILK